LSFEKSICGIIKIFSIPSKGGGGDVWSACKKEESTLLPLSGIQLENFHSKLAEAGLLGGHGIV
jgi:hypothetical protein